MLLAAMRLLVKAQPNPLVTVKNALPRMASNKIMWRVLRDEYLEGD